MNDFYYLETITNLTNSKIFKSFSLEDQQRIKCLRIPPNWTNVKISKDPCSKIQVTGMDIKKRTQYIYHPAWVLFSKDTKYSKVNFINFDKFNSIIKKYSKQKDFNTITKNYVIANMFILMRDLNIRVGNEKYLEENDSVGLCTLSKMHYKKVLDSKQKKNIHKFIFKGKRGVIHEKTLNTPHIKFIESIIRIPGNELFLYEIDNNNNNSNSNNSNNYKKIVADDLNQFLKDKVDSNMTCKDIRTYCANEIFKKEYSKLLNSGINSKKARIEATKITANELGNTPKVCRDSYIDPSLYIE